MRLVERQRLAETARPEKGENATVKSVTDVTARMLDHLVVFSERTIAVR